MSCYSDYGLTPEQYRAGLDRLWAAMPEHTGPTDEDVFTLAADAIRDVRVDMAALIEALTPSAETKAAYAGEFTLSHEALDDEGLQYTETKDIPWTAIKSIMKTIRDRARVGP